MSTLKLTPNISGFLHLALMELLPSFNFTRQNDSQAPPIGSPISTYVIIFYLNCFVTQVDRVQRRVSLESGRGTYLGLHLILSRQHTIRAISPYAPPTISIKLLPFRMTPLPLQIMNLPPPFYWSGVPNCTCSLINSSVGYLLSWRECLLTSLSLSCKRLRVLYKLRRTRSEEFIFVWFLLAFSSANR